MPRPVVIRLFGAATAATLAIDSYVHAHDAGFYDAVRTSVISPGTLLRLEAAVAGLIAVVLYTYVDVGPLGPLPNMYDPTSALPGKAASAWAEGIGVVLAAAGRLTAWRVRASRSALATGARPWTSEFRTTFGRCMS